MTNADTTPERPASLLDRSDYENFTDAEHHEHTALLYEKNAKTSAVYLTFADSPAQRTWAEETEAAYYALARAERRYALHLAVTA